MMHTKYLSSKQIENDKKTVIWLKGPDKDFTIRRQSGGRIQEKGVERKPTFVNLTAEQ